MADILNVTGSNYTTEPTFVRGEALATGALRRKYNFGDKVSELNLASDPFFRFVSMVSKKPTDDPQFKFTEKRSSYTKRYGYMSDYSTAGIAVPATAVETDAGVTPVVGTPWSFAYFCDYKNNGNLQNIYGQTISYYEGVADTQPQFFIPGQIIKIPHAAANAAAIAGTPSGYTLWKVNSVDITTSSTKAYVNATCVKADGALQFCSAVGAAQLGTGASAATGLSLEALENFKSYVVGTAFAAGSGYPESWQDQPYSTSTGQTQIFKTSAVMNNTDRATVLKYQGNEWARIWKEKLIEHKWDIEQSMLFGNQNSDFNTTQGAVDFISTYGNSFNLSLTTKTQDSFLDDMSALLDPRYNNASSTVFFASTAVYNWLHKLSGYFSNNVGMVNIAANYDVRAPNAASFARSEMAATGKKKVFGVDITTISTVYGDMNIARNIHLDGTNIGLLGINMKYCAYRPLVGNGLNRDTGIYVGVQTLENSGVDRRVDQILTEAGMEWSCPETHSLWIQS